MLSSELILSTQLVLMGKSKQMYQTITWTGQNYNLDMKVLTGNPNENDHLL